uniref:NADH dehydrogenase subunit 6 n=1 Tax=Megaustenia imperator imperator TaxID=2979634 RepID=A0A977PJJ9_9EUPU|nr:NADH dehydrogenase subunit 6 [Megaustenia imperator imperator]
MLNLILSVIMMMLVFTSMFLFIKNPMSIGFVLFFMSLMVVISMSFYTSTWYGYMLFLVYIGGLLVMFIYICMISSNFRLGEGYINLWEVMFLLTLMFMVLSSYSFNQKLMLFSSLGINGVTLPFFLFLSLGVYLLICFLIIINIIFSGGVSLKIESQ